MRGENQANVPEKECSGRKGATHVMFVRWEHVGYFQVNGECMRPARPGGKSVFSRDEGTGSGNCRGQTASSLPTSRASAFFPKEVKDPWRVCAEEGRDVLQVSCCCRAGQVGVGVWGRSGHGRSLD